MNDFFAAPASACCRCSRTTSPPPSKPRSAAEPRRRRHEVRQRRPAHLRRLSRPDGGSSRRRGIRFQYFRPFTEGTPLPEPASHRRRAVLLGGGPWGTAGGRDVPTLRQEMSLICACLMQGKPVVGIELGAQILALAADGGSDGRSSGLRGRLWHARSARGRAERLPAGALPARLLYARPARCRPAYARVLAEDDGRPPGAVPDRRERLRLQRPSRLQAGDGRRPDHGVRGEPGRSGRRRWSGCGR